MISRTSIYLRRRVYDAAQPRICKKDAISTTPKTNTNLFLPNAAIFMRLNIKGVLSILSSPYPVLAPYFQLYASSLSQSMQCILSKEFGPLSRESTSSETALVTNSSLLLIDLDMVDQPVDIREGFWVLSDELIAGWRLIAALIFPDVACPVAAESVVDNNLMVFEVGVDIALSSERSSWSTPRFWVWFTRGQVSRDLVAGEEVDVDIRASPVHGINTTSDAVKAFTIVRRILSMLSTTDETILLIAVLELHNRG